MSKQTIRVVGSASHPVGPRCAKCGGVHEQPASRASAERVPTQDRFIDAFKDVPGASHLRQAKPSVRVAPGTVPPPPSVDDLARAFSKEQQ
jgi:hypothetical protein